MKKLIVILSLLSNYAFANKTSDLQNAQKMMQKSSWAFEENKGQVTGSDAKNVKFVFKEGNLSMFLMQAGIAYQFHKVTYPEGYKPLDKFASAEEHERMEKLQSQIQTETYRMDVHLEGANPNPKIKTEGRSEDYIQYYNHNALDVRSYQKVTYYEVYPNIDWVVYINKNAGINEPKVKYDFIVHPGGDPSKIKLKTEWVEELTSNADGSITLNNRMGSVTEQKPVSFQDGKTIETNFVVKNNIISFQIENYNSKSELIIDPFIRIWGSYYGGNNDDFGTVSGIDKLGNIYFAGYTLSNNLIATTGSHQASITSNNFDAYIVKFNSNGVRQWSTYYGGSNEDFIYGLTIDKSNNLIVTGQTSSDTLISTPSSHQPIYGGGNWDAFIAKFNSNGVRQWSTYYGGVNGDGGRACITDSLNNIFFTGITGSLTSIATNSSHQSIMGGSEDAYILKLDSNGVRQWSTYYGAINSEGGTSCAIDNTNNIYILGTAAGGNSAISTTGAHQTTFGGALVDVFLVKFNSNGIRQWGTYYGGNGEEYASSCTVDKFENIYISGHTTSINGIASIGAHQTTNQGNWDAFIAKFNSNGVRQWGTYYGGSGGEGLYGYNSCTTDLNGNFYITGSTNSDSLIASSGAYKTSISGTDAFIVKFDTIGTRQWGTYYGSGNADYGLSMNIDNIDNLYLIGTTTPANNGIASLNCHQSNFGGGLRDAYIAKFRDCLPFTHIITQDTIKACGDSVLVSATSGLASYSWSNGKTTASFFAKSTGWYKLTATNSAGCPGTDSVFVSILKANILNNDTAICAGQSVKLSVDSVLAGAQFAQCAPLPSNLQNGLVGFWPFCGNANDLSGNGNNGTVNGATLTSDRFGNTNSAYSFDGINDYINTNQIGNTISNKTFSVWVSLNTLLQSGGGAVSIDNGNNFDAIVYNELNNGWIFGSDHFTRTSTTNFLEQNNQWVHLVYSYAPYNFKIYRNGLLIHQNSNFNVFTFQSTSFFSFGRRHTNGAITNTVGPINSKLDDIAIWNRALSPQEIQQLYNSSYLPKYLWSTGDTTPTINVTPSVTTKYWVRVSNGSHFCTDTVTVTVNNPPVNLITQDTIKACGDSVLVSATSGLASYSWSNSKTTTSFFAKSTGWYKVTATNSAGCPGTDSVFVSILKANIRNNDTAICAGQSVKLSADSLLAGAQFAQCAPLPSNLQNGLVGFWPFCGNANDVSGNGNNGTVNGATLTADRFGNMNNSYIFNGVSNKIEIPATSAFDVLQFTISYWLNTNSSANQHLVSKSNWSNAASEMFCTYLTSSQICFEVKKNSSCVGGNGWNKVSSNLPSNFLSNWHLLTYSYDGTNMKFYLNGTLLNSSTLIGPIDLCSGGQLKIGAWWSSHTLYYSGKIDDMSFWNRALNSQEIQQLYTPAYPQTYLWSTGDTTPAVNVTPSVTTKYWVRVSNGSHFCTDTFTVTVDTNTRSTINQTICQGQSLLGRTVSGVYIDTLIGANNKGCDSIRTLNLTVNDTTKKDSFRTICKNYPVLFNGLWIKNSGTYKDTLVNTNGCDSFLYLHLTVNDTTKKDSLRTICKNYPVLFNGLWRNNSGTYKDTLVNAYGCDSFLYLHLTVNDTTKKDSFRTICKNHPVLFNGLWINNSGTYKDTLVNANGCDSFIYLYLKVDTIPISNAGINKSRVNCAGDSVQIGTMPNANYAYSWSPNLFLSDNNTAQPWVKTQTSTNYILIVTDNNTNCQSRDTVEVNVIANNLDATKQVKHIRCFGENNGEVTIKGINGYTDYSYKIGTGNFIDSGTYKNLAPGIIPYTVKDSKGCLYSDTFLITEPLLLKIDTTLKKNILCYRGEDGEIQVLVSGGNNPYNYNWSSSPLNLPKIGNLKAGTYHITITDKNGCIINRSFDLIQPDAIKLGDTLIQKNICNGDSMASIDVSIIGGVGQYEYIWSNGDKSKKVTNLKQGHYSLTVTDSAKCTQKYQFSIMDYPKLIFDTILSLNFNCDNEGAIILSAKGGLPNYSYSIDSGINFSSNKRFKVEEASAYQVQIKDNNGCIIKSSTKVRGSKRIEIEAYPKETITLPGEPITLGFNYTKGDSRNVQSILWKPSDGLSCTDCANPIATPYTPMQYSVTIFYNNLCSATEVINIRHTNQNSELFIPNSFFPESSNPENQTFKIYSNHLQKATLKIFNRWGEKVFESNNAQNIGWDGTYKGEPMKTAVYIYWAEVTYLDGRKVIKSGDLTLIR